MAFILAPAGFGCHRPPAAPPPPKPRLTAVRVDVAASGEDPRGDVPVDRDAVGNAVRERLEATGLFAGADGGAAVGEAQAFARVDIAPEVVTAGSRGEVRARVRVRVETRPSDAPGAVTFEQRGGGSMSFRVNGGATDARVVSPMLQSLAVRLARDLIGDEAARRALATETPAQLRTAMAPDAGELRAEAMRIAGERHLHELAPDLLKLLDDPDEPTRDAALGALIALRDQRAVSHLANNRSLRDRREMRKILHAMALIGGPEADDYLSFVAASHEDEDIRAEAAAARAELARREGDAAGR